MNDTIPLAAMTVLPPPSAIVAEALERIDSGKPFAMSASDRRRILASFAAVNDELLAALAFQISGTSTHNIPPTAMALHCAAVAAASRRTVARVAAQLDAEDRVAERGRIIQHLHNAYSNAVTYDTQAQRFAKGSVL